MPSRAHSMPSSSPDSSTLGKVQQEVWNAFSRKRAQDVIVELVLPSLRFQPRQSCGLEGSVPGLWPAPASADEARAVDRTFRDISDRLRGMGVSEILELRSAGSLVVRLNEDQVSQLAEWPAIRKVYANSSL